MGRGAGLALALALLATLVMAAPVVIAPGERIFGSGETLGHDDPNRDALVVIEQFRTGRVPAPYMQPLTDLPGQVLARAFGPVAAYNVLILVTFPLAAFTAYLLARHLLLSHFAAMVASLAYAFLPFHVFQAGGHPHIAQTQWLPLYFLALWRCVDRPDLKRAILLLAAAMAVTLSNFYGGFIAAVMSPVALIAYGMLPSRHPGASRLRRVAITGLVLAAAVAVGLGLIRQFAPSVLLRPGTLDFPRAELFTWSAKWWSYFIPPVDHPWLGARIREFWDRQGIGESLLEHQQVSLGFSLLVLSFVPLWLWLRRNRDTKAIRIVPLLTSLAFVALLCSLSPERRIGSFTFVRPSAWLYEMAPMFRAYSRFGLVVGLMTALLAGAGAAWLWRLPSSTPRRAAALLLGLAALEYAPFPPWPWRDVLPTRAHRWLASQSGPLRVLDCVPPLRVSDSLAASLVGHKVSLLGTPSFDDCGEPRLGERLSALGYTHVVVRRNSAIGAWLAGSSAALHAWRFMADGGLQRAVAFEDSWILEVKGERPIVSVGAWLGFFPREYEAENTWRWMSQRGALRIHVSRASPDTVLELELRAFPEARVVEWFLNGKRAGGVEVTTEWQWFELSLGPLALGESTLALASSRPAVVAKDVLHNDDSRSFALAVGRFNFKNVEDR